MASYKHTSLRDPGRMIRTLALHAAQNHSAALFGTLAQISLYSPDQALSQRQCHYEALSYVWGAPDKQHTIQIGSSALPITANCDAALRSLRQQSEDRLPWVDSICIDQTAEGTSERNQQVALMGQIYNIAQDVCIWLGEGDFRTDALIVHMRALYDMRDDSCFDPRHELSIGFINEWGVKCDADGGGVVRDMVESLISHPWYERMWTLQELLLAKHATVVCGKQTMPWDSFCEALELIEARFPETSRGMRNCISCLYAYSDFKELEEDSATHRDHGRSRGLESIMQYTRIRHATDPRDKMIALYGISQRLNGPILKPDYGKPISEVYKENTASILREEKSLWPLDQTWSPNRREDLPSWVPDWSEDPRWSHDLLVELGDGPPDPADREMSNEWKITAQKTTPDFDISSDYKELTVKGYEVGIVVASWDDSMRATIQEDLVRVDKTSVDYALASRIHGAEQIKFFRRIYSGLRMMEKSKEYLDAFSQLLLTFRPTQPESSFRSGSQGLDKLFLLTEASDLSDTNRSRIVSLAQDRLSKYRSVHQKDQLVMSFVASDIDAALDILLSFHFDPWPSSGNETRVTSRDILEPDLRQSLGSALPFWGLVRGLSISRSIFITDSGVIGYAYGKVHVGDIFVRFHSSRGPHILRSDGARFRLQSLATTRTIRSYPSLVEQCDERTFTII